MFKSVFSFQGRINRREYLLSFIIFSAGFIIMHSIVATILFDYNINNIAVFWISSITCAPFAFFYFAQGAKRCHDISISMWWQLMPFFGLFLLLKKGDLTRNKHGKNPSESRSNKDKHGRDNSDKYKSRSRQSENPYIETRKLLKQSKITGLINEDEYNEKNALLDIQESEYNEKKYLLIRQEEIDKTAKPILDNLDKLVIDGIFTQAEYDEKKKELYDRLANEFNNSKRSKIGENNSTRIFQIFKKSEF